MIDISDGENKEKDAVNATAGFTVGGFPLRYWEEWEADCKENYKGRYWLKIWADHQSSQNIQFFKIVLDEINDIKRRLAEMENKPKEEKKEDDDIKLLGQR